MKASLLKKSGYFFLGVLIIVAVYQIFAISRQDEIVYPNIIKIFKQVGIIFTSIDAYLRILKTILRVLLIILLSVVLSSILGLAYYKFPSISYFFYPLINILKASPFAIIAIYLFLAIGNKNAPYVMCFFVIFPIVLEGFLTSIDRVDKSIKDDLQLLNIPLARKFFSGFIPICMPYIVMSVLQSFGLGIKTMIMAEYLCNIEGSIGEVVYNIKYTMDFDVLLAWLVVIVVFVCIIDAIIRYISKKLIIE